MPALRVIVDGIHFETELYETDVITTIVATRSRVFSFPYHVCLCVIDSFFAYLFERFYM